MKQICSYGFLSAGVGCAIGALFGILGVIPQAKSSLSLVLVAGPLGLIIGVVVGVWKSLEGHAASVVRHAPRAPRTLLVPMSGPTSYVLRVVLVIVTIVYALAGLAAGAFSVLAVMMFDAPGSTQRPELWIAWFSIVTFPVLCFFAIKWGWSYYDIQHIRRAYLSLCLPSLSIAGLGLSALIEYMTHR